MATQGRFFTVLLLLAVTSVDCQNPCLQGDGQCQPKKIRVNVDFVTMCCSDDTQVPDIHQSSGNTTCTCIPPPPGTPDAEVRAWAEMTNSSGRMCQYGEGCSGSAANYTVNDRFKLCCRPTNTNAHITVINGASYDYIGCRCVNEPVPVHSDSSGHVVPQTGVNNSTGESCSYNNMCRDFPRVKCESVPPKTTLCCYGSRGMKVSSDNSTTHCTCTNEFHGKDCVAEFPAIPGASEYCKQGDLCNSTDPNLTCNTTQGSFCCSGSRGIQIDTANNVTKCTCTNTFSGKSCVPPTKPPTSSGTPQPVICQTNDSCMNADLNLKCESAQGTFCCYGTLGIQLDMVSGNSRCTCTNSLTGKSCMSADRPSTTPSTGSSQPNDCLYGHMCDNVDPNQKCESTQGNFCCNGTGGIHLEMKNGVTRCTCSGSTVEKSCLSADSTPVITAPKNCQQNSLCTNVDLKLKCEDPQGGSYCCNGSGSILLHMVDGVPSCTCQEQLGEKSCGFDVMPNSSSPNTGNGQSCMSTCSHLPENEKCELAKGQERCCPPNMSVSATYSNGMVTTCTCTPGSREKTCNLGNGTSDGNGNSTASVGATQSLLGLTAAVLVVLSV